MKSQKEKAINDFFTKAIKRIGIPLKTKLISSISKFRRIVPEDQLLIFSDPRGGSTWLSEILNTIPKTALIWEPLNIKEVEQLKDLQFGWRQYIPEDIDWHEAKLFFGQVLSGKIINEWTMIHTSLMDYLLAKIFIVKICRGNMLLPWITSHFNLRYRPVYLLRHPFAVVNSQLKHRSWDQSFRNYKIPNSPYNDFFLRHKRFLESLSSKEEILTAIWCLSNNVPIHHPENNKKWISVYYEDLLMNPGKEINRIFSMWDIPIPDGIENSYRKKSITTVGNIDTNNPEFQLSRWKRELTGKQIDKMSLVLEYFDIKEYSAKELIPVNTNDSNLNELKV